MREKPSSGAPAHRGAPPTGAVAVAAGKRRSRQSVSQERPPHCSDRAKLSMEREGASLASRLPPAPAAGRLERTAGGPGAGAAQGGPGGCAEGGWGGKEGHASPLPGIQPAGAS
jgi:hypothetical protein